MKRDSSALVVNLAPRLFFPLNMSALVVGGGRILRRRSVGCMLRLTRSVRLICILDLDVVCGEWFLEIQGLIL